MPRTRPLTTAQRKLQQDQAASLALLESIAVYKARTKSRDQDIANSLGIDRGVIARMKKAPLNARLADVRSVARQIGMSPEAWLMLGGFRAKGPEKTEATT